jgi:rod shape-determining protein MreD
MNSDILQRPVHPGFIVFTFVCAITLTLAPASAQWWPDWIALVLMFWTIHHPRRIGLSIAFFLGLALDVRTGTLLGEHALSYVLLGYMGISIHRRVLWLTLWSQAIHLLPIFWLATGAPIFIRLIIGAPLPDYDWIFMAPLQALMWPLADWLLLAPQRRPEKNTTLE